MLVHAHRADSSQHELCRDWLRRTIAGDQAFALSELVLSSVIRIVTHARIFDPPSTIDEALAFANDLRGQERAVILAPGGRHWDVFSRLIREAGARANLVTDAYFAAIAIESGCELISTDGDYARFSDLKWRRPF
ncbi:MAG TPA: type II toxin-antitoxin system VapC family toxin [Vicinamibacterales bacterium]